jgi:hypothetical protein
MAKVTDAQVRVESTGRSVRSDCFGNNAAIECPCCRAYPILLIARPYQRGSSPKNPACCRSCGCRVHIVDEVGTRVRLPVLTIALI